MLSWKARAFVSFLLFTGSVVALSQTAPSTVTFSNGSLAVGPDPVGMVTGDFNEDGLPDLAVLDGSNFVQIVRNDGSGNFSLAGQANTGMNPVQIVAGKFTLSGHQDLAAANASDKTVTVLLGKGDGTFTTSSFALNGTPQGMIAANLLNNGLTQLAIVECAGTPMACDLNVYEPTSLAAFSRTASIRLPGVPVRTGLIASDDFNLDGKPDIAVATATQVLVFTNQSTFNGAGPAKLALRTIITPPNTATIASLVSGHFNAGAAPDLAVEVFDNVNDTNFPNSDYVYLNMGAGTFFLKSKVPNSGGFGHTLVVSDINGDGIQDLVQSGTAFHNSDLNYALGHGDGTFAAMQPVAAFPGGINSGIVARDLNLDSRHDLATTSVILGEAPLLTVLLNQNALINCPPPGSATVAVKICAANPSTNSVRVQASGNSPAGVKRVELWIDFVKRAQSFSDQLNDMVSVSSGTHRIGVVAVDQYDAVAKKIIYVTVP